MARGGKRKGAGRKPNPVKKVRITTSVPEKYKTEIQEAFQKIAKAYTDRCTKEL